MQETPFMRALMIALGAHPSIRIHRQNCGKIPVRDRTGRVDRLFDAGPPSGAADISGIVAPEGWRIEIETKAEAGKVSSAQKAWEKMIAGHGGIYVCVRYDESRTPHDNVRSAVCAVEKAIEVRRSLR